MIIKDPDVNCLEGDFHSNMCSLLLWHFQFRANQSARRALFISTVTFKNTQLLGKKKDVCSPESTRESRLGFASFFFFVSIIFLILFTCGASSAAITSFFRSKVNMPKWSLRNIFPRVFSHTCVAQVGLQLAAPGKAQPGVLRISASPASVTTRSMENRSQA